MNKKITFHRRDAEFFIVSCAKGAANNKIYFSQRLSASAVQSLSFVSL